MPLRTTQGVVHFLPNPDGTMQPVLWKQSLPVDIIKRLVTDANPVGDITISDFELAATVDHHDMLVHAVDLLPRITNNLHYNTATVYWKRKGSTTTTKAEAYILRMQALLQCYHRYVPHHDHCRAR
jgi:hypothetical protein